VVLVADPEYAKFKKMFNDLFGDPSDSTRKTQIRENIDKIWLHCWIMHNEMAILIVFQEMWTQL
jgi:hypothetical protein